VGGAKRIHTSKGYGGLVCSLSSRLRDEAAHLRVDGRVTDKEAGAAFEKDVTINKEAEITDKETQMPSLCCQIRLSDTRALCYSATKCYSV